MSRLMLADDVIIKHGSLDYMYMIVCYLRVRERYVRWEFYAAGETMANTASVAATGLS